MEIKSLKQVVRELLGKRVYHCYSEVILLLRMNVGIGSIEKVM